AIGTVASAGTLGILIPPAIMLVVMAEMLQTSAGRPFAAAPQPGTPALCRRAVRGRHHAGTAALRPVPDLHPGDRLAAARLGAAHPGGLRSADARRVLEGDVARTRR